ncbi:MAG: phosphatidate cytidylyltransferase [Deltaproteobacteria bacterium]|nr:phosphatidate cytidylyltransferase [Deltaproteobacteria bacterium]
MKRILSALALVVLLAVPVIIGPQWVFFAAAHVVIYVSLYEFYNVCLEKSSRPLMWIGLTGVTALMWSTYFFKFEYMYFSITIVSIVIIASGLYLYEKQASGLKDVIFAVSGMIYPSGLLCFWILLRNSEDGKFWMIFGLLCTFASDIGAYYMGKSFGRHSIAPILSPKKTWEGLAGGIILSAIAAMLLGLAWKTWLPFNAGLGLMALGIIGCCIGVLDLAGDLTASMIKRDRRVKDMGNLIPGHGGMLDRMDGIVPVGTALYFLTRALY